ncbi:hypothetical protein LCGC14_0258130 [marine sediment metagenome]|uniref:Uncharacterized protein n=1 Tax=marine sediment metagenome TaxID=412755 RepID=A0A0F9U6Y6_9ZZZZ
MTLPDGKIKSNCPACLEPDVLSLSNWPRGYCTIRCRCGLVVSVPAGPNPAQSVALEIIGANELGEKQEGDQRLIVHEGEALDVIPADEREIP